MAEKIKAIGLFSGGLDSALAIKIVQEQGIEVTALNFVSPFCNCIGKGCSIVELAKRLSVPIKIMNKGMDYLKMARNPKYGYGKNMNPCIDCKIYIFRKAKKYAKEIGAKFIFTGEVLGQRPMSQQHKTLMLIEKEAGLKGKLVRPLCAGLLKPTEAEKKGWIDRTKLLKFQGRKRTPQIDLAQKYKIDGFLCGGSGCKLTNKEYSDKLRDLFGHQKRISMDDIIILSFGRHFRCNKTKIIVGKDEKQNNKLLELRKKTDIILEPENVMGPITLIRGKKDKTAIEIAASITARYSDSEKDAVNIKINDKKVISAKKISEDELKKLAIVK